MRLTHYDADATASHAARDSFDEVAPGEKGESIEKDFLINRQRLIFVSHLHFFVAEKFYTIVNVQFYKQEKFLSLQMHLMMHLTTPESNFVMLEVHEEREKTMREQTSK